jgi:hypothetical protein
LEALKIVAATKRFGEHVSGRRPKPVSGEQDAPRSAVANRLSLILV